LTVDVKCRTDRKSICQRGKENERSSGTKGIAAGSKHH
jgi:hypothetical protein